VKSGRKSTNDCTNDEEAHKIYLVEVLRIKKEVRDAKVFSETPCCHCKENNPAYYHDLVAPKIGEQQLNGEKIENTLKKLSETRHVKKYTSNYRRFFLL
jgi:hypothetical protein